MALQVREASQVIACTDLGGPPTISAVVGPTDGRPLTGVRVLVVEDEPLIAICVEATLHDDGALVFVASNACEAYRLIEQISRFDLLITDVSLGSGDNGFDIARSARATDPAIGIIYLSGRSELGLRKEGLSRAYYLTKPLPLARLVGVAVEAVNRHRKTGLK